MSEDPSEVLVVMTTFPDEPMAALACQQLVDDRLVACAQRASTTIRSIYRYADSVHDDSEILVMLKTTRECWPRVVEVLNRLHPYDVPEIIGWPGPILTRIPCGPE